MVISDQRRVKDKGIFYAVMFTKNINAVPCKMLKFTKLGLINDEWAEKPDEKVISHPDQVENELKNCYMLEGNTIIVVADEMILFLDAKMEELSLIKPDQIDPCINYVTCFTQDISSGFLLAC